MATEKVSLTLDKRLLREARKRAGRRGLSAFVDESLRQRLQGNRLSAYLDELDAKYGPIPESVIREVDRLWDEDTRKLQRARRRSSSTRARS